MERSPSQSPSLLSYRMNIFSTISPSLTTTKSNSTNHYKKIHYSPEHFKDSGGVTENSHTDIIRKKNQISKFMENLAEPTEQTTNYFVNRRHTNAILPIQQQIESHDMKNYNFPYYLPIAYKDQYKKPGSFSSRNSSSGLLNSIQNNKSKKMIISAQNNYYMNPNILLKPNNPYSENEYESLFNESVGLNINSRSATKLHDIASKDGSMAMYPKKHGSMANISRKKLLKSVDAINHISDFFDKTQISTALAEIDNMTEKVKMIDMILKKREEIRILQDKEKFDKAVPALKKFTTRLRITKKPTSLFQRNMSMNSNATTSATIGTQGVNKLATGTCIADKAGARDGDNGARGGGEKGVRDGDKGARGGDKDTRNGGDGKGACGGDGKNANKGKSSSTVNACVGILNIKQMYDKHKDSNQAEMCCGGCGRVGNGSGGCDDDPMRNENLETEKFFRDGKETLASSHSSPNYKQIMIKQRSIPLSNDNDGCGCSVGLCNDQSGGDSTEKNADTTKEKKSPSIEKNRRESKSYFETAKKILENDLYSYLIKNNTNANSKLFLEEDPALMTSYVRKIKDKAYNIKMIEANVREKFDHHKKSYFKKLYRPASYKYHHYHSDSSSKLAVSTANTNNRPQINSSLSSNSLSKPIDNPDGQQPQKPEQVAKANSGSIKNNDSQYLSSYIDKQTNNAERIRLNRYKKKTSQQNFTIQPNQYPLCFRF